MPHLDIASSASLRACIVSHRFGGFDGVSVEAEKWIRALETLGWTVMRAAGHFEGPSRPGDTTVTGMWATVFGGTPPEPDVACIRSLCKGADLVILDNAGTLWTAPLASAVWESEILAAGVPAVLRHHDPPWQTMGNSSDQEHLLPLHNQSMLHVTINELTRTQFASRWPILAARDALRTVYNTVDLDAVAGGDRDGTRARMGIGHDEILVVHPARNIRRKNTATGLSIAEALDRPNRRAHYWLTDPGGGIRDDSPATVRVHRGFCDNAADLYAAADLVVLPSSWEGWGLPVLEAAAAHRPVVAGPYPILDEIRALGVVVLDPDDVAGIRDILEDPAALSALTTNNAAAAAKLSTDTLPAMLSDCIVSAQRLAHDRHV